MTTIYWYLKEKKSFGVSSYRIQSKACFEWRRSTKCNLYQNDEPWFLLESRITLKLLLGIVWGKYFSWIQSTDIYLSFWLLLHIQELNIRFHFQFEITVLLCSSVILFLRKVKLLHRWLTRNAISVIRINDVIQ